MQVKDSKWWWSGPELVAYAALVAIGVPLYIRELWQAGKEAEVTGLASLWVPTVIFLIHDFIKGYVSRGSLFCFLCWVGIVVYAAFTHAV